MVNKTEFESGILGLIPSGPGFLLYVNLGQVNKTLQNFAKLD